MTALAWLVIAAVPLGVAALVVAYNWLYVWRHER